MTILEKHLKQITAKKFNEWIIKDSFKIYASASNERCTVQLGTMGNGMIAVCEHLDSGTNTYFFKKQYEAIELYKKLLLNN